MRAIYLNVKENKQAEIVEIKDELKTFYNYLDCDVIDIISRKIGRKKYSFIIDDEGLLKEDAKISAIDNLGRPMFVGNLLIVKDECDEEGGLIGLDSKDINYILKRVQKMYTHKHPNGYVMLTQCEY